MHNEIAALAVLLQRTRRKWLDTYELQRLREHLLENKADAQEEQTPPNAQA